MAAGDVKAVLTKVRALNCATFNGSTNLVAIGDQASVEGFTELSICAWIKPDAFAAQMEVLSKFYTLGYELHTTATGALQLLLSDGAASYKNCGTSATTLTAGVWNHVCVTANTTTDAVKYYINGAITLDATVVGIGIPSNANSLDIGRRSGGTNSFDGCIADVRMFNVVLTDTEVATIAAGGDILRGLIHRWRLASDYNDSVGTTNGTNTGTSLGLSDDNLSVATKAQRVASTDKWMIYSGKGGQVGIVNIE